MTSVTVELPDNLYARVETFAKRARLSPPEVILQAAEMMLNTTSAQGAPVWEFPKGIPLGCSLTSENDWRDLANE